jgi:hypothetical protein
LFRVSLRARLKISGISPAAAAYAGIRASSAAAARASSKRLPSYCTDGFLITYHDLDGKEIRDRWRWRNDPYQVRGFAAITAAMVKGKQKYAQPSGSGCFPRWELKRKFRLRCNFHNSL